MTPLSESRWEEKRRKSRTASCDTFLKLRNIKTPGFPLPTVRPGSFSGRHFQTSELGSPHSFPPPPNLSPLRKHTRGHERQNQRAGQSGCWQTRWPGGEPKPETSPQPRAGSTESQAGPKRKPNQGKRDSGWQRVLSLLGAVSPCKSFCCLGSSFGRLCISSLIEMLLS